MKVVCHRCEDVEDTERDTHKGDEVIRCVGCGRILFRNF